MQFRGSSDQRLTSGLVKKNFKYWEAPVYRALSVNLAEEDMNVRSGCSRFEGLSTSEFKEIYNMYAHHEA